jgi:hypothetical protein
MLELHDLHCESNELAVVPRIAAIAVCIDRNIGSVTVLVLAVAGCSLDPAIVIRRAKP